MSTIHGIDDTPLYNMKAVASETDLNPMTIRSWERRYGLPRPERSDGGQRIYSQRDINLILWLQARQRDGLSIRHAAESWHALEAHGVDPLQEEEQTPAVVELAVTDLEVAAQISGLRDSWIAACLEFDQQNADQTLTEAFARLPPELVCTRILQDALAQIGEAWSRNEVTVQQEHFASALAVRRLETLIGASPRPVSAKRILISSAPNDDHTFGILLLTYLLLRHGWDVIYLGANIPLETLGATVQQVKPSMVILAAQRLYTAATLLDVAQALQTEDVQIAYGGLIFNQMPALRQTIPGHFLGESLGEALQRVQKLLGESLPTQPVVQASEGYQRALRQYNRRRALIESHVWGLFLAESKPTEYLSQINAEMAQTIIAALKLGDIRYLGKNAAWFEDMIVGYRWSSDLVHDYLHAYHQASLIHLSETASVIFDLLGQVANDRESRTQDL